MYRSIDPSYTLPHPVPTSPQAQPFWYRCVFILIWAKVNLYKYVSCWLISVSINSAVTSVLLRRTDVDG